jgi:hypothetical protein
MDSWVISSTDRLGGVRAGSKDSGKLKRRTLLAAIVGLLVSPSIPARAAATPVPPDELIEESGGPGDEGSP